MSGCVGCVALAAELADERARRTTGGTPKRCDTSWANLGSTPPPASASDPAAPALVRGGMARSGGRPA